MYSLDYQTQVYHIVTSSQELSEGNVITMNNILFEV